VPALCATGYINVHYAAAAATAAAADVAKTLSGGAILGMSPCDIMPYLQGRTLWLIG
jgi:hypothetical protein